MRLLGKLVTTLLLGYTTSQQLHTAIHYLLSTGNTPTPVAFLHQLAQCSPQHKETLMTIAEQLEEMGRRKGLRQGWKEGHNAGLKEGQKAEALRIANVMLNNGLDKQQVLQLTGLAQTDLAHCQH